MPQENGGWVRQIEHRLTSLEASLRDSRVEAQEGRRLLRARVEEMDQRSMNQIAMLEKEFGIIRTKSAYVSAAVGAVVGVIVSLAAILLQVWIQ